MSFADRMNAKVRRTRLKMARELSIEDLMELFYSRKDEVTDVLGVKNIRRPKKLKRLSNRKIVVATPPNGIFERVCRQANVRV